MRDRCGVHLMLSVSACAPCADARRPPLRHSRPPAVGCSPRHRYEHTSAVLGCTMKFSVIDPSAGSGSPMPVIFWLSGLTCSDRNFIEKAGAFEAAVKHGVLIGLLQPDRRPAAHVRTAAPWQRRESALRGCCGPFWLRDSSLNHACAFSVLGHVAPGR